MSEIIIAGLSRLDAWMASRSLPLSGPASSAWMGNARITEAAHANSGRMVGHSDIGSKRPSGRSRCRGHRPVVTFPRTTSGQQRRLRKNSSPMSERHPGMMRPPGLKRWSRPASRAILETGGQGNHPCANSLLSELSSCWSPQRRSPHARVIGQCRRRPERGWMERG